MPNGDVPEEVQFQLARRNPLQVMAWIAVYASNFRRPVSIYRKCPLMAQLTQGGVSGSTFYPGPTRMQIEVVLSGLILRGVTRVARPCIKEGRKKQITMNECDLRLCICNRTSLLKCLCFALR